MLASIRRQQKGILIVVTAIVIVAFAWLYDSTSYDQLGATEVFSIDGRSYRPSEYEKLARTYDLCRYLGTYEFLMAMVGRNSQSEDSTRYVINLLVLRNQARKLGIRPSEDQIREFIVDLPLYQNAGGYDAQAFEQFRSNFLTPNGFSDADLYQLISDAIAFGEIRDLLGAGIAPAQSVIREAFEEDFIQITGARVNFPVDESAPPAEISDEAIANDYNANKQRYLSDPKRRIEYVLFEKPEPAEDLPEEAKKAQLQVYGKQVAEFAREVLSEGADFSAIAKKFGVELKSTEPFSFSEPPADFKDSPQVVSEVFGRTLSIPISDPVSTAKGYLLYNLLEVVDPKPLTLAEATPKIREHLERAAAATALQANSAAARAKLAAELASGKSFAPAVSAAGFTSMEIPPFSRAVPPPDQEDSSLIVAAASGLEPGELSNVLTGTDGAFLLYVEKKELLADDTAEAQRRRISDNVSRMTAMLRFEAWFAEAAEASAVKCPALAAE